MRNEGFWHLCEDIFGYLDHETLVQCRMVSKFWNESREVIKHAIEAIEAIDAIDAIIK